VLGLGAASFPDVLQAKMKRKKLKHNQFGCVEVGNACRGNCANCCSGICQGKKPKKGRKTKAAALRTTSGAARPGKIPVPRSCPSEGDRQCMAAA
jgi:hypothetical protein